MLSALKPPPNACEANDGDGAYVVWVDDGVMGNPRRMLLSVLSCSSG
jgi:hypothetical protein